MSQTSRGVHLEFSLARVTCKPWVLFPFLSFCAFEWPSTGWESHRVSVLVCKSLPIFSLTFLLSNSKSLLRCFVSVSHFFGEDDLSVACANSKKLGNEKNYRKPGEWWTVEVPRRKGIIIYPRDGIRKWYTHTLIEPFSFPFLVLCGRKRKKPMSDVKNLLEKFSEPKKITKTCENPNIVSQVFFHLNYGYEDGQFFLLAYFEKFLNPTSFSAVQFTSGRTWMHTKNITMVKYILWALSTLKSL
jgi:hypothetical protein